MLKCTVLEHCRPGFRAGGSGGVMNPPYPQSKSNIVVPIAITVFEDGRQCRSKEPANGRQDWDCLF